MKKRISNLFYKRMVKGLSKVLKSGNIPLPDGKEPIAADSSADLNIIAFGDPQISALSPLRSARVYSAVRDIEQSNGDFDVMIVAGDVAEYGAWCEYKMMAHLLEPVVKRFSKAIQMSFKAFLQNSLNAPSRLSKPTFPLPSFSGLSPSTKSV